MGTENLLACGTVQFYLAQSSREEAGFAQNSPYNEYKPVNGLNCIKITAAGHTLHHVQTAFTVGPRKRHVCHSLNMSLVNCI